MFSVNNPNTKVIDRSLVEEKPGFFEMDESDFWYHVRYDTPEETWTEFVDNLNIAGFNVWYVKSDVSPNSLYFEDEKQKLTFMLKFS
jgi:hypothetical protein